MSRIGIKPIIVDSGVTVSLNETEAQIQGAQGQLSVTIPHGIKVTQKDNLLSVSRVSDAKQYRALHGTVRALLQNAVTGVAKGFERKLELVGIGYRAALEGSDIVLQLGFTHPVRVTTPEGISAKIEKNVITLNGRDKHRLGQFAAEIRELRKPDPYKGKGIRYQGEIVRMKQGKAAKAAG